MSLAALVTVYHRILPAELSACLESLHAQTSPADELVVVADGPLPATLEAIIADSGARVVRLEQNQGSGIAAAAGMKTISTEFIARLDADDIAHPERFERQLAFLASHPGVDVVGTAMAEFSDSTDNIKGIRRLPSSHREIRRYAKINSPVNHPSVMMRRDAVERAGGYLDVHFMEDYDLFARMLAQGSRFHNLSEPLTFFRTSDTQFQRRTGKEMLAAERHMQRNLVQYGLISRPRSWVNLVARTAYRKLPTHALHRVYRRLFHR
ncbi:glycosyltransferase [Corynebacterium freiburgense]|uniref:glycosyltransferase n=1 Tax=Corynebacterium freiburgense TaxID=556548 RepID=UPI0004007C62|nr:glycosyltransferase [Corynebacterium freiburgense]WJZ01503.1 UDP-Gal:alpha-D-GlcNAc-diphosphoundecaprenol beta-1,3-galactosyltransferase [Corynebacterium freiburgense]